MPLRDPPPHPGALPLGSKVIIRWHPGLESTGEILAASNRHGEPEVWVSYTLRGRAVSCWMPRSRVRPAEPTWWERWQPRLQKLGRLVFG